MGTVFRQSWKEEQTLKLHERAVNTRTRKHIADIGATIKEQPHVREIILRELARLNITIVDSGKPKKSKGSEEGGRCLVRRSGSPQASLGFKRLRS